MTRPAAPTLRRCRAPAYVGLRGSAYPDRLPGARVPQLGARPAAAPAADSSLRPEPVEGADWQSGVTLRADRYRVLLDGEPVPGAVAARVATPEAQGWVDVARGSDHGDLRYEPDLIGERLGQYVKRYHGVVTLVRCRAGE